MNKTIDIKKLMQSVGINFDGNITVDENMSGLEENPKDDWLYLGVLAIKNELENKNIFSFACVGSANGIDVIAAIKTKPSLEKIFVTDILSDILPLIQKNIETNCSQEIMNIDIRYVAGRDCEPISEKVDFIYGNLPLIMVDNEALKNKLSTTTLTDAKSYAHLNQGEKDTLRVWSLLSQLGFLISAKEKLNAGGTIVTLIGGRIPYAVLSDLFDRAGVKFKELYCGFKKQSDAQFLKEYSDYEQKEGIEFCFYDYERAASILQKELGVTAPDIIKGKTGEQLKQLLKEAQVNATYAYNHLVLNKKDVGHLAHAFEVRL